MYNLSDGDFIGHVQFIGHHVCYDITIKVNKSLKPEFVDTITRAKARVEQYAEERLFDRDGSNGAQFSLRNNFKGWDADKKNDDSGDGKITIVNNIPRPEKQDE